MANQSIFFVGTQAEVGHHAAPLQDRLANVFVAPPDDVLVNARPADLAIFTSEHFDRFRDACCRLKDRNVATLYLIDGILEWRNAWENRQDEPACPWTMRPVLSHKVACIGPSQARVLAQWGNDAKIELVGIPRLDALCKPTATVPEPDSSRPFRLLVMTAKWPGFTDEQIENTVRGLKDLQDLVTHGDFHGRPIQVVWRLTQGLEHRIGVENTVNDLTGGELATTLTNVDAVITTPSTAILEAMLSNRPVAILDYNNTPHYVPAAWQITAREHISCVISQMLAPPERKMFFQRCIVEDALTCDGKACERLDRLTSQMLRISREQVEAGEPLRFPSGILPGDYSPATKLQHSCVYPDVGEFKETVPVDLQAQLAQSRRKIEHLEDVIVYLQSKVEEAHDIFDQIERHPIAGPIVRARKKIMHWVDRFREKRPVLPQVKPPVELPSPDGDSPIAPNSDSPAKTTSYN